MVTVSHRIFKCCFKVLVTFSPTLIENEWCGTFSRNPSWYLEVPLSTYLKSWLPFTLEVFHLGIMEKALGYLSKAWRSVKHCVTGPLFKRVHSFHHSFSYSLNHNSFKFPKRKLDSKSYKISLFWKPHLLLFNHLCLNTMPFRYFDHAYGSYSFFLF